jgi:hypothetical protein
MLVLLVACGGSYSSSSSGTGTNPQGALVVQPVGGSSSAIAAPGGTLQLAAYETVSDSYGSSLQQVMASWASGNTSVATVDGNGLVTAVAKGTAVITATAGSSKGTVTVTVGGMAAAVTIPPAMDGRLAVE